MKKYRTILMSLCLFFGLTTPVLADHLDGASGWTVTCTSAGKLESNFGEGIRDAVNGLQPGDDITLTVTLNSKNSTDTDWYMSNEAVKSFEDDSKASGGAYSYELIYTAPDGTEKTLYNSAIVGGETAGKDGAGLHEATEALKDYVYLGAMKNGQSGTITLNVALDGDSQGNNYRGTSADLNLNFAVELLTKPEDPEPTKKTVTNTIIVTNNVNGRRRVANTSDMGLISYGITFALSTAVFLLCLVVLLKNRQYKEGK